MKQFFTFLFLFTLLLSKAQTVRLVKDLTSGTGSSDIKIIGSYKEKIIFRLNKPDSWDLMISDGSESGTLTLKTFTSAETMINPLSIGENQLVIATSEGWTTTLYYMDLNTNSFEKGCSYALFGPCEGMIKYDNKYWAIGDGVLWELDTVGCTSNGLFSDDELIGLEIYNGHLYTVASSSDDGMYLIKSDGTFLGSEALKTFSFSGLLGPKFINFTKLKDKLYFTIDRSGSADGLYVTDGTEAGTSLIKKLSWSDNKTDQSKNLIKVVDDKLYFAARPEFISSGLRELYVSDGTIAGTSRIDVNPDSGMDPQYLTEFDNQLFFSGAKNSKIYKSSGSTPVLAYNDDNIMTLYGAGTKYGDYLAPFAGKLYHTGISPTFGNELMECGPASSEVILYNFSSGASGTEPVEMTPAGNKLLFFVGKNATSGKELFVFEPKITNSIVKVYGKELKVFPNPTSGKINLPSQFSMAQLTVMDANGNTISDEKLTSGQLDLVNLTSGLYVIKITDDTGIYTAKIIKQ